MQPAMLMMIIITYTPIVRSFAFFVWPLLKSLVAPVGGEGAVLATG